MSHDPRQSDGGPRRTGLRVLGAVAAAAALCGGALVAFTPSFQTNDDPTMAMIVSGTGIALAPDEHMVFTNVVVGRLLRRLYLFHPDLPWYGLYLVAIQACAHAALAYVVLARRLGWGAVASFVVYFATVGLYFLVNLQFTTTAFLAAQAGLLVLLADLIGSEDPDAPSARRSALLAVPLLTIASLVRFESFLLVLLLGSVPAGLLAVHRGRSARVQSVLVGLVAAAALAGAFRAYDRAQYRRDPAWRDHLEFIEMLPQITNYERVRYGPETATAYARLGFSVNDALLMRNVFFADPSVFSNARLHALLSTAGARTHRPPGAALARLGAALGQPFFLSLALAACFLLPRTRGSALAPRVLVGAALGSVAVLLALASARDAPIHVVAPILSFPLAVALAGKGDARSPERPWARVLLAVLALAAVTVSLDQRRLESARGRDHTARLRASLDELAPRPDRLYVVWALGFPYEWIPPLEGWGFLRRLHLAAIGWAQRSPVWDRMLGAHGIDDLYRALYQRPDVFFMGNHPRGTRLLEVFGAEHRGVRVEFEVVQRTRSFTVLRARSRDAGGAPGFDPLPGGV